MKARKKEDRCMFLIKSEKDFFSKNMIFVSCMFNEIWTFQKLNISSLIRLDNMAPHSPMSMTIITIPLAKKKKRSRPSRYLKCIYIYKGLNSIPLFMCMQAFVKEYIRYIVIRYFVWQIDFGLRILS